MQLGREKEVDPSQPYPEVGKVPRALVSQPSRRRGEKFCDDEQCLWIACRSTYGLQKTLAEPRRCAGCLCGVETLRMLPTEGCPVCWRIEWCRGWWTGGVVRRGIEVS